VTNTTTGGGCIRLYTTGPEWHINSHHVTVDFDTSAPPEITAAGDLWVPLTQNLPVVAAIASADETLTERGITAGISGGVSGCTIRLYKVGVGRLRLNQAEHYALAAGENSNLWLMIVRIPGTEGA
jgi:hypothetical protein